MNDNSSKLFPSLAEQLTAWRNFHGHTQSELESIAGLSHNTISRIETNQVTPRLSTLEQIARAMEISIEELQFRVPPEDKLVNSNSDIEQFTERLLQLEKNKRSTVLDAFNKLLDQMGDN